MTPITEFCQTKCLALKDLICEELSSSRVSKILEDLDSENLYWKLNTWYTNDISGKNSFWSMMNYIVSKPSVSLDELESLLKEYNISWRSFVHFCMDNIDGMQDYDQLFVMKKIIEIFKANKSLSWKIKEEATEEIHISNLEVIYKAKSENLLIRVPDTYNEDNIQMYLDNICMQNMPSNVKEAKELFGDENTKSITDAYFSYEKLTLPEDATVEPELEWDNRYDNKISKNAKLLVYSLDNLEYHINFEKFVVNDYNDLELDAILENVFKAAESNKIHPWAIEIELENINFEEN